MYIFTHYDDSNCRAYYRLGKDIYCLQDETAFSRPSLAFYKCTKDGEPIEPLILNKSLFNQFHLPTSLIDCLIRNANQARTNYCPF